MAMLGLQQFSAWSQNIVAFVGEMLGPRLKHGWRHHSRLLQCITLLLIIPLMRWPVQELLLLPLHNWHSMPLLHSNQQHLNMRI